MRDFAIIGAGFWAGCQLAAWNEIPDAGCVAICDVDRSKAEALARRFGINAVFSDPQKLFAESKFDFADIITEVDSHKEITLLALDHKKPVICQKPMAGSFADCEKMVEAADTAGVPFLIHENWRWQTPIRALQLKLRSGAIGRPFRASIDFKSGFPVFKNQPSLARRDKFIIADLGSHLLDVARFLFGEARDLCAKMQTVQKSVLGEDAATILMTMGHHTIVVCNMAYAGNYLEDDSFPETMIFIEGEKGSLELTKDYWVRLTTKDGTHANQFQPPEYSWADPQYALVQSSLVPCNAHLLQGVEGHPCETAARDNLKTMELVFAAYDSAKTGEHIFFKSKVDEKPTAS